MLRYALPIGWLLALLVAGTGFAAESAVGAQAPEWRARDWVNLRPGRTTLRMRDLRGRVVHLLIYRAADAAANNRAFDTLAKLRAHYGREDVVFVAIESVDPARPPEALSPRMFLLGHGLQIPGAYEVAPPAGGTSLRARYGARDGPWVALVDASGVVRASRPMRPFGEERRAIDALRRPRAPANPLIGTPFGSLAGLRWLRPPGTPVVFAEHRLTLLRWWTTNCPHCSASVPDLSRLTNKYAARGLRFVGVYHRKSAFHVSDTSIRNAFQRYGGAPHALAVDEGWRMLRPFMQRGRLRRATSISILVDEKGIIRWVHPGPRIHTSNSTRYAGPARDLRAFDAFLDAALPPAASAPVAPR